ncbi:hypothetical protein Tco_0345820 [Tanacetum coccineum]
MLFTEGGSHDGANKGDSKKPSRIKDENNVLKTKGQFDCLEVPVRLKLEVVNPKLVGRKHGKKGGGLSSESVFDVYQIKCLQNFHIKYLNEVESSGGRVRLEGEGGEVVMARGKRSREEKMDAAGKAIQEEFDEEG